MRSHSGAARPAAAVRQSVAVTSSASADSLHEQCLASFGFTVEALKLPPIAVHDSIGVVIGYQLEWCVVPQLTNTARDIGALLPPPPIASGVSPLAFAEGDEVHFNYSGAAEVPLPHSLQYLTSSRGGPTGSRPRQQQAAASSSAPLQYAPNAFPRLIISLNARMLDQSFLEGGDSNANGGRGLSTAASYAVGTLSLELGSHLPPHSTHQLSALLSSGGPHPIKPLRQRATLYLEQCIYQSPPVMIRVLVEGTVVPHDDHYAYSTHARSGGAAAMDAGAAANARLLQRGNAASTSGTSSGSGAAQQQPHQYYADGTITVVDAGADGTSKALFAGGAVADQHDEQQRQQQQAVLNGVEMAKRRAAQVRAKAREEAERERQQALTAGQRRAAAAANVSAHSSRATTPRGGVADSASSRRPPQQQVAFSHQNTSHNTSTAGGAPPRQQQQFQQPPPLPSLYAAASAGGGVGRAASSSASPKSATPSTPQPRDKANHSFAPIPLLTSPQPTDPYHHHGNGTTAHTSIALSPAPQQHYHANAANSDVRSPSLSNDILQALHRSNAMLKEDNDRLKQALEQHLLQRHQQGGGGGAASAAMVGDLNLSLAMSPLGPPQQYQQQQQHNNSSYALLSPSAGLGVGLGVGAISAVEELASLRMDLAQLQLKHAETAASLKEREAEVGALTKAKADAAGTEQHLRDEVARLETALGVATDTLKRSAEEEASDLKTAREQLLAAEASNRELSHKLHHTEAALAEARDLVTRVEGQRREEAEGRAKAEAKAVTVLSECTERVERYEASLRLGQQEMGRLHAYGEELNAKCRELASVVTSQAGMLEKRKEKILELRGIIAANEKHLPVGGLADEPQHARAMAATAAAFSNRGVLSDVTIPTAASHTTAAAAGAGANVLPSAGFYTQQHGAAAQPSPMSRQQQQHLAELGAGSPLRELSRLLATQQQQVAPSYSTATGQYHQHPTYPAAYRSSSHPLSVQTIGSRTQSAAAQQQHRDAHEAFLETSPLQIREDPNDTAAAASAPFAYRQPYAKEGQFVGVLHSAGAASPSSAHASVGRAGSASVPRGPRATATSSAGSVPRYRAAPTEDPDL